ncbi:MAG: glycosyltransferase family 2 protein [Oscillospiraceae bacterium]|nr:glycosyltransferase family 2 protein [Oscillospiraceae bacterium]
MVQENLISVIVPVYNAEQYLERCVDSLLNQTHADLEILLVNDGSKDGSGALCDALARKDSRIRVFHKENGGAASARNLGLDHIRGEYVAFADCDDWVETDAYEAMLRLARERNVTLVSAGRYDVNSETGEKTVGLCPVRQERISGVEFAGRVFLWDNCDSSPCDKLYHRSLVQNTRFPEGKICEDIPFINRVALDSEAVYLYDKPVYNYFHRPGSESMSKISDKTFHFSYYTNLLYPYIRDNYPEIEPQARYIRVRSLMHGVQSVVLANQEIRNRYREKYRELHRSLCGHLGFLLRYPRFGRKERLIGLLLICGLYLPVHKGLQLIKKRKKCDA